MSSEVFKFSLEISKNWSKERKGKKTEQEGRRSRWRVVSSILKRVQQNLQNANESNSFIRDSHGWIYWRKHTRTRWKRKERNLCRIFCHFWKATEIRLRWDTEVGQPLRVMSGSSFRFVKFTCLYAWYKCWAVLFCLTDTEVTTSRSIFEQRIVSQHVSTVSVYSRFTDVLMNGLCCFYFKSRSISFCELPC